jgi:hypothetical protein
VIFARDHFIRCSVAFFVASAKALDGIGPSFGVGIQWARTSSSEHACCIVIETFQEIISFSFQKNPPTLA